MKIIQIAACGLLILLGIFVFIFGGYDDSPGAQLLGVLLTATGIFILIRRRKAR